MARLDKIDLKILAALQRNGRMTNAALAEQVNLSPSPCLQRTKRLEDAGLIQGYSADIDIGRIGDTLTVFTEVTLTDHRSLNFRTFEDGIKQFSQVLECHLISGGYDYLLKFVCRSILDYQDTIEDVLAADLGIEKYFSYVVIKSPIASRLPEIGRFVKGADDNP